MKKGKKIVPQHIPNGQNYTEESLRELNSELSKFAYLALILYLGSEIGLFILSILGEARFNTTGTLDRK